MKYKNCKICGIRLSDGKEIIILKLRTIGMSELQHYYCEDCKKEILKQYEDSKAIKENNKEQKKEKETI